ncbi:hypothetical protein OIE63_15940 [Streptomyces sp. NBC_01795]|uniref:hypothetical protein n=1 Tax=Streptomyces sp. NBC_01795 TaxID=2975943 RepID=UPI002DD9B715|nr:hypothetical protein [Streptomyces sp. NBC_01795]WSA92892.1 hypothetical protein OIE63_15940 [Streptomyces sp. NBC_01795]
MNTTTSRYDNMTRHDRWSFRTMNDPRVKRYHATRAARRGIVTAHIALTLVGLAGMSACFVTGRAWLLALPLVALLAWIPATGLLNSMTRGLMELRAHVLDERQLADRGTVHTLAHRVTSGLMTAALLVFFVTSLAGDSLGDMATPLAVTGVFLVGVHHMLPLWIAALRVQDEPLDDPLDEPLGEPLGDK